MKKFSKFSKKINKSQFFAVLDEIIEHRLFRPVIITIVTGFVVLQSLQYLDNYLNDYNERKAAKLARTPIKINISDKIINFDIDEDQIIEHRVKAGDTMSSILFTIGASENDVNEILTALKKVFDLRAIIAGDYITIKYKLKIGYKAGATAGVESDGDVERKVLISSITVAPSPEREILVSRAENGSYSAKEIKVKLVRNVAKFLGTLKSGLFVDGINAGVSPTAMMNMINLYSYDVDFQRDIHSGDKFEILVESFYREDGKKVKDGDILFSSLTVHGKAINMYMYKIDGKNEYFDISGNSMRKSLLRTPINGARVSSGFGLRRHPILGYSKMHKGIDFAAPSGTPIYAAGSGTITYYGVKGGYGNFVQIRHNDKYSTAYGHASRFVKKMHVGSKVKQGEVVAYVGSTGRSTGPHLHFEVMYGGVAINPSKVKATSGLKLAGKELAKFKVVRDEIDRYRTNMPNQVR